MEGPNRLGRYRSYQGFFTRSPGGLENEWSSEFVRVLFHFNDNRMSGRDKIMVLRGTSHGDLVISLAQALECPRKTLLILTVKVHVDMRSLRALCQLVLQVKAVINLFPVL